MITVQSSRALGVFALGAVILAAISFAAVDVIIANARPHDAPCPSPPSPTPLIGTFALLASVVPAFTWFVRADPPPASRRRHRADARGRHGRTRNSDEEDL